MYTFDESSPPKRLLFHICKSRLLYYILYNGFVDYTVLMFEVFCLQKNRYKNQDDA